MQIATSGLARASSCGRSAMFARFHLLPIRRCRCGPEQAAAGAAAAMRDDGGIGGRFAQRRPISVVSRFGHCLSLLHDG